MADAKTLLGTKCDYRRLASGPGFLEPKADLTDKNQLIIHAAINDIPPSKQESWFLDKDIIQIDLGSLNIVSSKQENGYLIVEFSS